MTLWLGIIIFSLVSLLLIVWAGRRPVNVVRSDPLAFYKAQLKEIESDVSSGMLDKEDAESASLEIKRRLIKSSDKSASDMTQDRGGWLFITLGVLLVCGALMLYTILGKPDIAARPHRAAEVMDRQISASNPTTFKEAIAAIRQRLEETPDDIEGWKVLANTLAGLRRHSEAAEAYSQATKLNPGSSALHLKLGEQIMAMHDGQIVPAASFAFQTILRKEPEHPGAHFYLGLSQKQAGNTENAQRIWQALIERSTPGAPYLQVVRQELASIAKNPSPMAGPSQQDIEEVSKLSAEEQAAFIDQMIARLRAKLEDNPDNADGWLMLARSEVSRGNKAAAIAILQEGIKSVSKPDQERLKLFLKSL